MIRSGRNRHPNIKRKLWKYGWWSIREIVLVFADNLCIFMFLAVIVWAVYIAAQATYYQSFLGPGLERDLGFQEGSAYLAVGKKTHSAVAIVSVTAGGIFEKEGFRAGDVVPALSHTDLFKLLHRHRGQGVELAVVDGGPGPPFYERTKRALCFVVPSLNKM
jgi:hypothetical protein